MTFRGWGTSCTSPPSMAATAPKRHSVTGSYQRITDPERNLMKTLIAALGATLLLSACSTFGPKLETPHLSIVNVSLLDGSVWEQNLKVRMRVQNPNGRALPV